MPVHHQSLLKFMAMDVAPLAILAVWVVGGSLAQVSAVEPVPSRLQGGRESSVADGETLFVRRIEPLLREKCLACHGAQEEKIEGELDLRTRAGLLRGGESGEGAIKPGKPEESPLYLAVTRQHDDWSAMPPKEAERLTDEQLEWLSVWITAGAAWPSEARQKEIAQEYADAWSAEDGIVVPTSGGLAPSWTNRKYKPAGLWAYQPVLKPEVPRVDGTASDLAQTGERSSVDLLIEARLPRDVKLAPRADRLTLIRRATFDLTGLPPTPEQITEFTTDASDDATAFASLVDRLLESPHYGERMAQHWLDVVRYADSSGFANDYERGNAWRFRDYVVRAFNDDKPFDQFIREQIAGDEIDPTNPECIIATGFLRMGPWELTGMEVAKVARQRFLDDVTNSVGETFLAHSLQCARCHDHKFDPVPTRDYYSIQAVFATTQLAERSASFLPVENRAGFDEQRFLKQMAHSHQQTLDELDSALLKQADAWFEANHFPREAWDAAVRQVTPQGNSKPGESKLSRGIFNAARGLMMKQGVPQDQFPPKLVGFTPEQFGRERVARKGLERLKWEMDRYQPYALSVYSGRTVSVNSVASPTRMPANRLKQGELESSCILTGGDPFSAGAPVVPGVLSVIAGDEPPALTSDIEGRRRDFAHWVAHPDNPLTTRTIVNRLWLWHFNQPIAGNPNNFGSTGKRPTHPELLDWLASRLVESGWSIKRMHREMMNTDVYCRSSRHPDHSGLIERDPQGESYAVFRPRRLTAEELRDAMLVTTGELNRMLGGIPNRPEMNLEAALQPRMVMGTFAAAWTPNPLPSQRHRRSIYALKLRGLVDPMFEVFNAPAPDFSCERRESSTVTPQVFSLFNSHEVHARSLALAHRAIQESTDDVTAIARCFELAYGRSPTGIEQEWCQKHWGIVLAELPTEAPVPVEVPLEVVREAVEENTGERFTFREVLYSNAEYVPDLQLHQVDRRTRALATLCLAIFNSNEFVYVY